MTSADPWMCRNCGKAPVPALGETLCADCAASTSATPEDHSAEAVKRATTFLETSVEAASITGDGRLKPRKTDLAIAAALQGILVCQIELVELSSQAGDFMLPAGTIMLPEPEPEMGPKPWGPVTGRDS
jgi:hypothetical protein